MFVQSLALCPENAEIQNAAFNLKSVSYETENQVPSWRRSRKRIYPRQTCVFEEV
jgi:hypothetical protein